NAYGVYTAPTIDTTQASGTIANASAMFVNTMGKAAGGQAITNAYGIYAALPTAGTNNTAILATGMVQSDSATPAAGMFYASGVSPQIALGNTSTYASRTQGARLVLATSGGNYAGFTQAGDAILFNENGRLYLSAGAQVPTVQSLMIGAAGNVHIGGPS